VTSRRADLPDNKGRYGLRQCILILSRPSRLCSPYIWPLLRQLGALCQALAWHGREFRKFTQSSDLPARSSWALVSRPAATRRPRDGGGMHTLPSQRPDPSASQAPPPPPLPEPARKRSVIDSADREPNEASHPCLRACSIPIVVMQARQCPPPVSPTLPSLPPRNRVVIDDVEEEPDDVSRLPPCSFIQKTPLAEGK
jgi:hypothetical protein